MDDIRVGDIVWFGGQCQPPLKGDARLICLVEGIDDPEDRWMRSYRLREISTGDVSINNYPSMVELKERAE